MPAKPVKKPFVWLNYPNNLFDKAIASAGLLAAVIDSKFNRHMPLYRQEAMFHEAGLSVTRGTLSNWLIHSAKLLTPLVKLLETTIQDYDVAYVDETPLQVLKEKGRLPTQQSYMGYSLAALPKIVPLFIGTIKAVRIKFLWISLAI